MDYFGMTWREKNAKQRKIHPIRHEAYDALMSIPALAMLESELPSMAISSSSSTLLGVVLKSITSLSHAAHAFLLLFTALNLALHFQSNLPYSLYIYSTPLLAAVSNIPSYVAVASFVEVAFYFFMTLKVQYYQRCEPVAYNLKTAPKNVTLTERSSTFERILRSEKDKVSEWINGWFFDAPIESITSNDILDFLSWTFFEGRSCEHLNDSEQEQLLHFKAEIERKISTTFTFQSASSDDVQAKDGTTSQISKLISDTYIEVKGNIKDTFRDTPVGDGFKRIKTFKSGYNLRGKLHIQKAKFLDDRIDATLSELNFKKKLLEYSSSEVETLQTITRLTVRLKILRSLRNEENPLDSINLRNQPKKFAKFNFSRLYDIIIWPAFFHILLWFYSSVLLHVILKLKGFRPVYKYDRRCWHFKAASPSSLTPIVFVHGIGIGLMPYLNLISNLQKTGRPVILLEVSEVSAFRFFDFSRKVMQSSDVVTYVEALLQSFNYEKANFIGHSYGTSWLSYLHKRSKPIIDSITYIDPICFNIHCSDLVRSFVYQKSDRQNVACLIRGDLNVRWVMQREFCWNDICLFQDEMGDVRTNVFLSEDDCLVPSRKVAAGFGGQRGTGVYNCKEYEKFFESKEQVKVCVWNAKDHGDFLADVSATEAVVKALI
mmetsp:Transcript_23313/g.43807  ORF Transcript_23313/g.43807 Transcript_23313/m.43807 type:complete len:660 (-) Transcript_23313:15-1994(-)|eukprot:CAMPEP_0182499708 /NCGR_PEP_ID=MMETSP1321-20130603/7908_1 /TAXON_ID=91990 /ORGANISM="Bolidomonas sp., Strain RCC1657" /LENGTH=659 /DNA_ID=CAMNT_0024703945 /DNA_START=162 /DNA_END=2141 /DNA_ORIENTATION=-